MTDYSVSYPALQANHWSTWTWRTAPKRRQADTPLDALDQFRQQTCRCDQHGNRQVNDLGGAYETCPARGGRVVTVHAERSAS
ncbi:MAG: hypothetical protein OXI18_11625 [bacterium]|nr:hypothetical protein [bacterium]